MVCVRAVPQAGLHLASPQALPGGGSHCGGRRCARRLLGCVPRRPRGRPRRATPAASQPVCCAPRRPKTSLAKACALKLQRASAAPRSTGLERTLHCRDQFADRSIHCLPRSKNFRKESQGTSHASSTHGSPGSPIRRSARELGMTSETFDYIIVGAGSAAAYWLTA